MRTCRWDGMQPSAGNERTPQDVLQLKDMNRLALSVIASRASEIAAVLVNPLQCAGRCSGEGASWAAPQHLVA